MQKRRNSTRNNHHPFDNLIDYYMASFNTFMEPFIKMDAITDERISDEIFSKEHQGNAVHSSCSF